MQNNWDALFMVKVTIRDYIITIIIIKYIYHALINTLSVHMIYAVSYTHLTLPTIDDV